MSDAQNNEKSALVPRLRFPEFRSAAEWKEKPLSEACRITQGGTPDTTVAAYWGGTIQWLTPAEMGKYESKYIIETVRKITDEGLANCSSELLPVNSVVISTRAPIGHLAINQAPMAINQGCRGLVRNPGFNAHFIFFALEKSKAQLNDLGSGNTFKELSGTSLKNFGVPFPGVEEQQKIADCLSSLDELITAETQKLDALKTHKKGLMQQLFPRKGETVPRLRFPEFREAGEWEQVTLGEVAEIKLGKMLDAKKHTTGNLLPYLNNLAVRWNEVDMSNLPKMYFDDDELDRFGLKAGDVVVCEGGEPGRSAVWDGRLPDLKFQKAVHRVRFKVPFEPRLLVLFLESIAGTPRLESFFTGGGIKHLTQEVFARIKIPFTTHAEQQRISGCLASLDDLIIAQAKKIDILKTHKKGLMQQLFPVLDEATA